MPTRSKPRPAGGVAKSRAPVESLRVRDLVQVRALANPLRIRLLEAFADAPRTTKQVAQLLGEKPTRLYHHVDALAKAGFLRLHSTRPNRGTIEKYYEAVARRFEIESSLFEGRAAVAESSAAIMARTVLDTTRTQLLAYLRSGTPPPRGLAPIVGRMTIKGTRADLDAVRKKVLDLVQRCERLGRPAKRRGGSDEAEQRWTLTLAFYPQAADET